MKKKLDEAEEELKKWELPLSRLVIPEGLDEQCQTLRWSSKWNRRASTIRSLKASSRPKRSFLTSTDGRRPGLRPGGNWKRCSRTMKTSGNKMKLQTWRRSCSFKLPHPCMSDVSAYMFFFTFQQLVHDKGKKKRKKEGKRTMQMQMIWKYILSKSFLPSYVVLLHKSLLIFILSKMLQQIHCTKCYSNIQPPEWFASSFILVYLLHNMTWGKNGEMFVVVVVYVEYV